MEHKGIPLIYIGYKYNAKKVLYFMVTDITGITKVVPPYLSNYPDQFSNVPILPVYRPLFIYELFGYFNKFDSHNKSRQSDLVLEKF